MYLDRFSLLATEKPSCRARTGIQVVYRYATMDVKQEESELVVLIFILVVMAMVIAVGVSLVL